MALQKSKVSTVVWMFIIGACLVIDGVQIALDLLFEVGVVVNRFIDLGVGIFYLLFLFLSGELTGDPQRLWKKVAALGATFLVEQIPDLDIAPLWSGDALYDWRLSRQRNKQVEQETAQALRMRGAQIAQARNDALIQQQNIELLRIKHGQDVAAQTSGAVSDSSKRVPLNSPQPSSSNNTVRFPNERPARNDADLNRPV